MEDVALTVDAVAICRGNIWDPKKERYVGTIDYGTAVPEIEGELFTEALVLVVFGIVWNL